METPYGSVLPSSLFSDSEMRGLSAYNRRYQNFGIKIGVVINIIETDDERNTAGLFPEYDVVVIEQDQDIGYSLVTYRNCLRSDSFGGIAEYAEGKLRSADKIGDTGVQKLEDQNGSLVLLNCLNGSSTQAVIVGGVQHPKRKRFLSAEKGHAFIAEFNGLQMEIDKEGAFSVVFLGATDNEGKPLKTDIGGSFFKITSNGSVEIGDDKGEIITLDKEKNKLSIASKKEMSIQSGGAMSVSTEDAMNISVKKDLLASIEGAATFNTREWTLKASGQSRMDSQGLEINAGAQLKAQASQIILDGMVSLGGASGTPALTMSTLFVGTGNLGFPVISRAIGPFSSKVRISS